MVARPLDLEGPRSGNTTDLALDWSPPRRRPRVHEGWWCDRCDSRSQSVVHRCSTFRTRESSPHAQSPPASVRGVADSTLVASGLASGSARFRTWRFGRNHPLGRRLALNPVGVGELVEFGRSVGQKRTESACSKASSRAWPHAAADERQRLERAAPISPPSPHRSALVDAESICSGSGRRPNRSNAARLERPTSPPGRRGARRLR